MPTVSHRKPDPSSAVAAQGPGDASKSFAQTTAAEPGTPRPFKDLGSVYRDKYRVSFRPESFSQLLWCRAETAFVYLWVLTQLLCLLVGLTVLHFTTFSAIVCYLVNGVVRGRRELTSLKN